jgi:acetolactate synthase-1/2/3 large subunit
MFAPVTKSSVRVEEVDRLPGVIRHAFRVATSGRPGPTHVELEGHVGDVLELQPTEEAPDVDARHDRLPPYRPAPDPSETLTAARLLATAQRPVIVAGGGVRLSRARAAVIEFAERFGVPVAASLSGKDAIPAEHPLSVGVVGLYSRECANRIVGDADVVMFLGTKAGSQSTHSWRLPDPARKIIHCDIDPEVIGVNYVTSASLVGDVAVTLERLSDAMTDLDEADRSRWLHHVRTTVTAWYDANASVRGTGSTPLRPERLCADLSAHLPEDALVVADTGHAGMWSAAFLDLRSPDQTFIRAAGSLGWALPAAIGAQCALPDRPVVAFTGDGGLWYHLAELETAARWNIPVKVIVNNNNSLNQEIDIYRAAYGGELRGRHGELWQFRPVDFAAVARAMGVESERVEAPDDLPRALERATRTDGPFLLDVVTDAGATAPLAYLPECAPD